MYVHAYVLVLHLYRLCDCAKRCEGAAGAELRNINEMDHHQSTAMVSLLFKDKFTELNSAADHVLAIEIELSFWSRAL